MTTSTHKLVARVAADLDCTQKDAARVIASVLGAVAEEVARTGAVRIRRFGTFRLATTPPKRRFDLQNGGITDQPALQKVRFVPSPQLETVTRGGASDAYGDSLLQGFR